MADDYLREFVHESEEQITTLNNALLDLENDPSDEDAMERIFRTAHTLKSNAGAMGFNRASDLAHAIEDLLEEVRAGRIEATPELMDTVFAAVDEFEMMVDEVERGGEPQREPDDIIEELREYVAEAGGIVPPSDGEIESILDAAAPKRDGYNLYHVRLSIAGDEAVNGPAVIDALDDAFELFRTEPSAADAADGSYGGTIDALFGSVVNESAVKDALDPVEAVDEAIVTEVTDRYSEPEPDDETEEEPVPEEPTPGEPAEDPDNVDVDELLDSVDHFDDIDEMAEQIEDTSGLEDMGEAGTFDDLDLGDDDDLGIPGVDDEPADEEPAEGADASSDTEADTDEEPAPEDEPEDANETFKELKEEVDPVSFDELQDELDDLEFDEYSDEEEVGFDELLDEEELADDDDEVFAPGSGSADDDLFGSAADDDDVDELLEETIEDDVDAEADAGLDDGTEEAVLGTDDEEPAETETEDAFGGDDGIFDDIAEDVAAGETGSEDASEATEAAEGPDDAMEIDEDFDIDFSDDEAADAADPDVADAETADAEAAESGADTEVAEAESGADAEVTDVESGAEAEGTDIESDVDAEAVETDPEVTEAEPTEQEATEAGTTEAGSVEADDALESEDDQEPVETGESPSVDADASFEDVSEPADPAEQADPDAASVDFGDNEADFEEATAKTFDDDQGAEAGVDVGETIEDDSFGDAVEDDSFGDIDESAAEAGAETADDSVEGFGEETAPTGGTTPDEDVEVEAFDSAEAGPEDEGVPSDDSFGDVDDAASFDDPGFDEPEPDDEDEEEERDIDLTDLGVPSSLLEESAEEDSDVQSIRVDVDRMDVMLNLIEGLVTSRARLRRALDSGEPRSVLDDELSDLEDVTSELQDTVMDVRLVPLNTVVGKLPRTVRDIARESNKQVDLEMSGTDVEIDRSVLNEINDPLVHLVRNAVDHGIESPEDREAAGKPETGTIELRAERARDRVIIEVEDDGRGLDPDDIRAEAIEEGIVTEEEAESMDDEAVYELVFHSGLSTSEEITDISGRGVGMDVVANTVEDLDGEVSIESTLGEGTTIRMELPVTLAIAEVLFVRVGDEEYGIPIKYVEQIGPEIGIETQDGQEVLVSDGGEAAEAEQQREVIRLDEALDAPGESAPSGMLVHIRGDVRPIALRVDSVRGQQEVVIKPFEGVLESVPGLSGATVLGDGDVVNILDVETI